MSLFHRFLFLAFCFLSGCSPKKKDEPQAVVDRSVGKVVAISDGDTFTYLTEAREQVKVRMHGIDCPEKKQAFGEAARQKLSSLIFGKQVRVQAKDTDRYRRVVAIVFVDNLNVNEEMIRSGMAWHYRAYDKNPAWSQLQEEARLQRVGLWSHARPTPPWDWRRLQREKRKANEEVMME